MMDLLVVGVGGFFGAITRYLLGVLLTPALARLTGINIPHGTLFVNITGSFLLALLLQWEAQQFNISPRLYLLVATGFFGAYTTFSTYANESVGLIGTQGWAHAVGYIVASNGLSLLGVLLGIGLFQMMR